jgi:aspartyl protease family protein
MFALFWVTAFALVTLYFSGMLDTRRNPNQRVNAAVTEGGRAEVILQRNRQGHYLANGEINGESVEFLVDTGATLIAMPLSVARRLGLKPGAKSMSKTAAGLVPTYLVTLDSVSLGAIERRQIAASVIPDMPGDSVLLGMSFLRDLELVQRGTTMTLRF